MLVFIATIVAVNMLSQNSMISIISYPNPTSLSGNAVTTNNINKRSAFVIDYTGNKWVGLNSGVSSSFQLMKFNGTQWDTFPAFASILPTNKVNALAVDLSNHLWIGSNTGLTMYDGTTFTSYNTSNSNLASDTIISLACGNGNVYAGTNNKGLSVFNGSTFTNYNTGNGMNSNLVTCITLESPTAIWLGNSAGLEKFDGSNFTFNYITGNNTAETINCIYIDGQHNKWLGTNAHGVIKYDNANFYTMQQLYPNNTTQDVIGGGNWPTVVKSICKGPNGGVLFSAPAQTMYGSPINGCTHEILGNQINIFPDLVGTASSATPYGIMQHDIASSKIYFISPVGATGTHILESFDANQYVAPNQFDVSTTNSDFLDINNVNALITDNSQLHTDNVSGHGKYFVPKQNNTSPLYASSIWIGGYVNGSDLRVAAMTYRQNGSDFWPGPLDASNNASIDTIAAMIYNRVWKVNKYDIANFQYHWNAGHIQNGSWTPVAAITSWPGNPAYPGQIMAPFVDVNNDGAYNWQQGDYPLIKGDQMIWSVFNDNFNKHTETGSVHNMGIEVHASAYAFTCPNIADSNVVLNNTTFYNYQIFNRSNNLFNQMRISLWMDSDLGNYQDDYIGCDVMNDFGYTYNGDNYDEDAGGFPGYHSNLPVFACNILAGPVADAGDGIDNNHNCIIDEPGERCMMSGFTYFNNSGDSRNGNPSKTNGLPYYNLMSSIWENGEPMTYGNQGLNAVSASNPVYKYLFPGDSDPYGYGFGNIGNCSNPVTPPVANWSEESVPYNPPGDRRFMVNVGPFTMQPYGMAELDYALVFTQDSVHCDTSRTCLLSSAVKDNQRVKRWFNTNTYPTCLNLTGVGIKQNTAPSLNLKLYPNPANTNVYVEFASSQQNVTIEVYDMLGKLIAGFQYNQLDKYAIIPVDNLQSGMYMVKVKSQEDSSITKFVKE